MKEFSFIHCADLHLDTPFSGIATASKRIAEHLRKATFKSFEQVVNVAVEKNVSAILIAGDVFNADVGSISAQLRFRKIVRKATDHAIPVFVVCGNHDPLPHWMSEVPLPKGVHLFGKEPECLSIKVDDEVVAVVCGVSFPRSEVRENLAKRLKRPDNAPFAIALLHCNVGGLEGHENYAPCSIKDLESGGFDYWALGHIHKRMVLRERDPCIVYPGTTQGRTLGEIGKHGCYLVKVTSQNDVSLEFIPVDTVRWEVVSVSIDGIDNIWELHEKITAEMDNRRLNAEGVLIKLEFVGRGKLNRFLRNEEELKNLLDGLRQEEEDRDDFAWIADADVKTAPELDVETLKKGTDFIAEFLKVSDRMKNPETIRQTLKEQIPSGVPKAREMIEQMSDEELLKLLTDAEWLGISMLMPREEDEN